MAGGFPGLPQLADALAGGTTTSTELVGTALGAIEDTQPTPSAASARSRLPVGSELLGPADSEPLLISPVVRSATA